MGRPKGSKNKSDITIIKTVSGNFTEKDGHLTPYIVPRETTVVPVPGLNAALYDLENEMTDELPVSEGMPVKVAFLHQSITWPGFAGAEKTISEAKIPGVRIFWDPKGLILKCKNKQGREGTCIVPHANVANAILL